MQFTVIYFFIGVLLVVGLGALIKQWLQQHQEQHVDHQQTDHPDHNDHHHFDDGGVSILVFALAARTELLLFALDFVAPLKYWSWSGLVLVG